MPEKQQIQLVLKESEAQAEGVLHLTRFSKNDRIKRGFSGLGLCWLAAVAAVFIPILHFFLVPLFLVCGPIVFYFKFKQLDAKEKVEGSCPSSGEAFELELESNTRFPYWGYCPDCKKSMQIIYDQTKTD